MDKLKPCPFCGGDARFGWFALSCNIDCPACGISIEACRADVGIAYDDPWDAAAEAKVESEARNKWNTRATPSVQEAAKVLLRGGSYEVFGLAFSAMDTRMEESPEVAFTAALRALAGEGE